MWDCTKVVSRALSVLPRGMAREVGAVIASRRDGARSVREIIARRGGISRIVFEDGTVSVAYKLSGADMDYIIKRITESSLYAYRDTMLKGYLPLGDGIRVGVCGRRYSEGESAAISDLSALVFRIPSLRCDVSEELYGAYSSAGGGLLIYSLPSGGKTTALRALAMMIGERKRQHVVMVDERCELGVGVSGAFVDVLRGYSRAEGIEIAIRTLSAEVIVVDELMGEEVRELKYAMMSGVPVIASTHAATFSEAYSKPGISELISLGVFKKVVGISKVGSKFTLTREEGAYA